MAHRETWGLRLFLAGLTLGLGLMIFVVAFDNASFYQNLVASTTYETTPLLGYALDVGILLAFAMTVAGIACFSTNPSEAQAPVPARAPQVRTAAADVSRRDRRRRPRPSWPSMPHGST